MRKQERASAILDTKAEKSTAGGPKEDSARAEKEFKKVYDLNNQGRYDESLELLLEPNDSVRRVFESDINHALYCAGDISFKKGDFKRAIRFFSEALRSRPDDVEALFALGNSYSENGSHREASSCFFVASIMSDKNRESLFNYAGELMDMGDYSHALLVLRSIKEKNVSIRRNIRRCISNLSSI